MTFSAKLRRAPGRVATGAFILNAGVGKLRADESTAAAIHGMASAAYPILEPIPPKTFLKLVALGEISLGGLLLAPIVPAGIAGAALTTFAGGLLGMYWRTPSLHQPGNPRPTAAGTAVAKDVWMLAIGISMLTDSALSDRGRSRKVSA